MISVQDKYDKNKSMAFGDIGKLMADYFPELFVWS